jgi:flagellar biosynthetic protein FliR
MLDLLDTGDALLFLAILFRVSTALIMLPILGHRMIPARIRVVMAVGLSLLMAVSCREHAVWLGENRALFPLLLAREIMIGMIIGFVMNFIFVGHQIAGRFVDIQMGYGMANVVDPVSSISTSILSRFKGLLAIAIFLSIDGHHLLIQAIHNSLDLVPFEPALIGGAVYEGLLELSAGIFVISMKISAPVVVSLVLADVGIGIMARIMPQMNVFIVGFPVKILLGVGMLIVSVPMVIRMFESLLYELNQDLTMILRSI